MCQFDNLSTFCRGNDNHQSLGYGIDVPTSNAQATCSYQKSHQLPRPRQAVDFRNKDVEFKLRVQPFSVKVAQMLERVGP